MQPHAGVQVVIVGLAGHVGHGEVYSTVGDGHCRGHRERERKKKTKQRRDSQAAITAKKEFNVSSAVRLSACLFPYRCI